MVAFVAASPTGGGIEEAAFAEVCSVPGLDCLTGLNEALRQADRAGTRIDGSPHDSHWNAAGHALAGRAILDFLEKGGYLEDLHKAP